MNARQLIVLAGLAIVSVVATAAVMRTTATTVASDRRGEAVVPALRTKANDITGLTVRDGANSLSIERRDNGFVASDSGFPVKIEMLRDAVASIAELTFDEARTADPTRYGDLGLAESGSENVAKELVFRGGNGNIADIFVGNRDTTVGIAGGGQFVRLNGQPQTWLARGSVRLPSGQAAWYMPVDFDIKRSEIKKLELTGGGRDEVTAHANPEQPGDFTLENAPKDRTADSFKVSRLATPFDAFAFQEVRRRTGPAPADARRLVTETSDGVRLTLTSIGQLPDGWVQVTAEAMNDGTRDKASAIAAKTESFEFRLPSQQLELLGWTVSDLLIPKQEGGGEPKQDDGDLKQGDGDVKQGDTDPKPGDGDHNKP